MPNSHTARHGMRAVIYLRVSTQRQADSGRGKKDKGDKGFSITEQQEVCELKAEQLNAEVVAVYIDEAETARVADRPKLMRMMERIKTCKDVDYVIVHKLDRFSRDRFDEAMLQLELRKGGAKFISATENINGDTPGDRALHGFLAVFADYYSANLGHEVKKGLRQKVKNGGTSGAARLGYLNVREQVGNYSVASIAEDPERAPLIRWAWKAYATGEWTLHTLGDELRRQGLTTRATPKRPAHLLHDSQVHRVLVNRYYLGKVSFDGVEHDGNHPALVDQATFDKVQAILRARNQTGEKPQKHLHYLKGDLACSRCGGRFGITTPTNRHGTEYSYFYCLNRQKRRACVQRFASIENIEKEVEDFWRTVHFPNLDLDALRADLTAKIETELGGTSKQIPTQQRRITKLENERKKLLQAFYADAIPQELLREEQARITREVAEAGKIIEDHDLKAERAYQFLEDLLTLCDDPHSLYLCADEPTRRLLNHAVALRFWIMDEQLHTVELNPGFAAIQDRARTLALGTSSDSAPAVPEPWAAADTASVEPPAHDRGKTYARAVNTPFSGLCGPLSGYLGSMSRQNPRPDERGEGLNVVTLVGRLGVEPRTQGLKDPCGGCRVVMGNADEGRLVQVSAHPLQCRVPPGAGPCRVRTKLRSPIGARH